MAYLDTYREDVKVFEWETLLAEITQYRPREIKRAVEERNYARFNDEIAGLRIEVDEMERRMNGERDAANLESLSNRG